MKSCGWVNKQREKNLVAIQIFFQTLWITVRNSLPLEYSCCIKSALFSRWETILFEVLRSLIVISAQGNVCAMKYLLFYHKYEKIATTTPH